MKVSMTFLVNWNQSKNLKLVKEYIKILVYEKFFCLLKC